MLHPPRGATVARPAQVASVWMDECEGECLMDSSVARTAGRRPRRGGAQGYGPGALLLAAVFLVVLAFFPGSTGLAAPAAAGHPTAPRNLVASPGTASVDLTWDAPASSGSHPLAGYVVTQSLDGVTFTGSTTTTLGDALSTGVRVTGLANDVPYHFRVQAVNQAPATGDAAQVSATPLVSGDGTFWQTATVDPAAFPSLMGVAFGNGTFVAVGSRWDWIYTSTDGLTWTKRPPALPDGDRLQNWTGVAFGGGTFVIVSRLGAGTQVMTSPDGITWTPRAIPGPAAEWQSVAWGDGVWVAVAGSGTNRVLRSTDNGVTWTRHAAADEATAWFGVTWGNGTFVAAGLPTPGAEPVMASPDGHTWAPGTLDKRLRTVTYGRGLFVTMASAASALTAATSIDGTTWMGHAGLVGTWNGMASGNGRFVAVASESSNSRAGVSPDGATWTMASLSQGGWQAVAYGNGRFVAVASSGTHRAMVSTAMQPRAFLPVVFCRSSDIGGGTSVAEGPVLCPQAGASGW